MDYPYTKYIPLELEIQPHTLSFYERASCINGMLTRQIHPAKCQEKDEVVAPGGSEVPEIIWKSWVFLAIFHGRNHGNLGYSEKSWKKC